MINFIKKEKKRWVYFLKYILLSLLLYFSLFGFLDTLPLRTWDESRLAINAQEMLKNNNFIVTHFEGIPDLWNTKPPLLIWLQVFFMKIIGVSELSVRLPSAFAALFTVLLLMFFFKHYLKNSSFGFIVVLVLISSQGYIELHGSRTGDYDTLLTFFMTLSALLFFAYCHTKKNKYLLLFFLFTSLSVLTKSVSGLLFLPALFLYAVFQKKIVSLLKNKYTYIGLLLFIFLVGGYYFLREYMASGYIKAVQANELFGRYLQTVEGHKHPFLYYSDNIIENRFHLWYLFLLPGIAVGLFSKEKKIRQITQFSSIVILTFFLIISLGETKLFWYDLPMYPFFAILVGVFLHYIFMFLKNVKAIKKSFSINVIPFIFLFFIVLPPYQKILEKTYKPTEYDWDKEYYEISYYLQDVVRQKISTLDGQFLAYNGYHAQLLFYINILQDEGVDFSFKDWKNLSPNDTVIATQNEVKHFIETNYEYEILNKQKNINRYIIKQSLDEPTN